MAKGRNTTTLQTRVPDYLADAAKAYAERLGLNVNDMLKGLLLANENIVGKEDKR